MSRQIIYNLVEKRGIGFLFELRDLLNKYSQKEVAEIVGMDEGQFSHLVKKLFSREVKIKPEVLELLQELVKINEATNNSHLKLVKREQTSNTNADRPDEDQLADR